MPLRVVLVDDHEVVRNGIKALLAETPDVSVGREAGNVKDAIERARWAPADTRVVLDRLEKGKHLIKDERLARLSAQEERILEMIADGKTNNEIGQKLHLAEKTVKNYVTSILSKLEVARRAEAAAYLARHTTTPGA